MIEIQQLLETALAHSGADGCIAIGQEQTEVDLRWANNELTTNGQHASRTVTVISVIDTASGPTVGVISGAATSERELDELVSASERAARSATAADEVAALVEPYPHSDDWSAAPSRTEFGIFSDFAGDLGRALASAESAGNRWFGFAQHRQTATYLATSTGLRRRHDQRSGRVEINAKSSAGSSAWLGVPTDDFTDLNVAELSTELNRRLGWGSRRVELPAGRYETLLPPSAVADLMIYAYWTASARDADEGRNAFSAGSGRTRIGERLSPLNLTLSSDPSAPGLNCAPFEIATSSQAGLQSVFDNGHPVQATNWITDGVLTNLIRTRGWAQQSGAAACPAVDNLSLRASGDPMLPGIEEMIAQTERGLLLTCLWYIREVDPQNLLLTGLTRDGVYLVENGEVTGEVNNFRFNESPIELLGRVTQAGCSVRTLPREWSEYFTRTAMPPLRVAEFNMSSTSQAS